MSGAPPSVHLCDWPQADAALIDEELSAATSLAMRLSRLGRSARAGANLRVRQPLAELVVDLDSEREQARLPLIHAQLLDELNVKEVRLAAEVGGLTAATVKPNFRALGPRFGRRMKEVTAAIAAADAGAVAAQRKPRHGSRRRIRAAAGRPGGGDRPARGICHRRRAGLPGWRAQETDPELRAEGMVREAVHLLNNHRRKQRDYSIVDKITLFLNLGNIDDPEALNDLRNAFENHEEHIRSEVLANEISLQTAAGRSGSRRNHRGGV